MPLGYDIKEEVKEIGTEVKQSRNTFLVLAGAGLVAYLVSDGIKEWWKSRKEEEYEEEE